MGLMVYGVYLYFCSRSLRLASKALDPLLSRSHVALWKWIQRFSRVADRFQIDRRSLRVRRIFVDETLISIGGREYWLWIAYEPSLDRCLMMHLSVERTILVCYMFLKRLRARYGRKPILTDAAGWYGDACRWLRLPHSVYPLAEKNLIERFIQEVKDRTECFDDSFPCRKQGCKREHVWNWLNLFTLFIQVDCRLDRFASIFVKEVT